MIRIVKWFFGILGGLLGLVLVVVAAIYIYMGSRMNDVHEVAFSPISVPDDEASLAEGARLAKLRGCNYGCHGEVAEGNVFFEMPDGTRVVASDLGRIAQEYSAEDLERAIRHGVRPDGTSLIGIMPSGMLYNLNDADLGKIIAYLKDQAPNEELLPKTRLGPAVRAMLLFYERTEDWNVLAAEGIDHEAPRPDAGSDDPLERGEYLATTSCSECHASDLRGGADGTPSLAIVAAYTAENFLELMRTGVPIGGRELDLMAEVARSRFANFTDEEIGDLHMFLQTLATTAD